MLGQAPWTLTASCHDRSPSQSAVFQVPSLRHSRCLVENCLLRASIHSGIQQTSLRLRATFVRPLNPSGSLLGAHNRKETATSRKNQVENGKCSCNHGKQQQQGGARLPMMP